VLYLFAQRGLLPFLHAQHAGGFTAAFIWVNVPQFFMKTIYEHPGCIGKGNGIMGHVDQAKAGGLDVAYVAHLARLHLTDDEVSLFQGQMEQIVRYVEKIGELDVSGVAPLSHTVSESNIWREDLPSEGIRHADVMRNAPEQRDGLILVPKIME
jgi:aspartyl-tRNA(Asn)/glutamyl-tRNA(Gln) amidotransferase subunit C